MHQRVLEGVLACGVLLFVVTGCWPMPNRISVGPDGLFALTMPDKTDGSYEALPQSGRIWLIDSLTGRVQTVLTEGANLSWATFSPDGNTLLYVDSPSFALQQILSGRLSHPWRLMLFDRRSNTQTALFSGDHGFIWAPTFSPDARKIAYYRGDGESQLGLYIFDRDAGTEKLLKLVQDSAGLSYAPYGPGPLWSPDGQGVFAFHIEKILPEETLPAPQEITEKTVRVFAGRLALMSIECGCEQTLFKGFFPLLPVPLFLIASPNGKLYVNGYDQTFSVDARERVNLYEITVETGEQAVLYDGGGIALAPALSPDGERLLFTVIMPEEPVKADLYLLDLTSAAPARKLTDDGRSGFGFWLSHDELGFLKLKESEALRGEIWARNLSTGAERNFSALVAVQSSVPQLISETRAYQQSLERVESQLQSLSQVLTDLSRKLDAVQTQSLEFNDHISQRLDELGQQIGALLADMSAVKTQISKIDKIGTEVEAASMRPTLSVGQLVVVLAIALLITVIAIVVLIRRALHTLAQQIAFPPQ
ncbi:MAG: hypothetical protein ACK4HB_01075 [Candidatus Bipolaricaulia bacterium]